MNTTIIPSYLQTNHEQRMYSSEREENFRWLSDLFATRSAIPLTSSSLASPSLVRTLAEYGECAEIAHGSIDPTFVFAERKALTRPNFPLAGYVALTEEEDLKLVGIFPRSRYSSTTTSAGH